MNCQIVKADYISDFIIRLKFRDGTMGDIDQREELHGPVLEPLQDLRRFREFSIDPDFHTMVWPNGADLAPEFLYENCQIAA